LAQASAQVRSCEFLCSFALPASGSSTLMATTPKEFFPISELSAYQAKWTIKARVTSKSVLRTWTKGTSTGKVFDINLLDAEGGEIRASFFNMGADRYFEMIQVGSCYTLSRGSIKVANKQFNSCSHRYELTFDANAEIVKSSDDAAIETMRFSFVNLRAIESRTLPCTVDICGVVVEFRPTFTVQSKDGQQLVKRDIVVADNTTNSMTVTLWGDRAKQEDKCFEGHPVVGLKGVAVKEWNGGRSGSLLSTGALVFKPTSPEADAIQLWWSEGGGSTQSLQPLSREGGGGGARAQNAKHLDLVGVRSAMESLGDQPEIYSIVARLAFVNTRKQGEVQPLSYLACLEPKEGSGYPCNKRVDEARFCASCNRAGKVGPKLNARCRIVDFADQAWFTTFHEAAQQILGMTAEEVHKMERDVAGQGDDGRELLEAAIRKQYFARPLELTVRAKLDSYNGQVRPNVTVVDARQVQRGEHGRRMLKEVQEMLAESAAIAERAGTLGA